MYQNDNISKRIDELRRQIAALPRGSVTRKTIKGKVYYYHRWTENKKRREKYIPLDELESFNAKIVKRKALEAELKEQLRLLPAKTYQTDYYDINNLDAGTRPSFKDTTYAGGTYMLREDTSGFSGFADSGFSANSFLTNIRLGKDLIPFAASVKDYKKRECFDRLHNFVYGDSYDKVMVLYGLRRTGKTTMIRQIFADMSPSDLERSAFMQVTSRDTLSDVNKDLKVLERLGFCYIFIDEVTLMEDFIEGAALFSDIFAARGMKIVLSGTDSLGFLFTEDEQLYDRCILLHTTFIPYREFENVLGICGIDEYIRYGGTMSPGGSNYNKDTVFSSKKRADEYVDTSIARNIQHSLRFYQYEGHFRRLKELYEKNELTSAINRVVEDINHRFTLEVLTRCFKSHDLGISAANMRRDRSDPTDILDQVDTSAVTENLRMLLEILNKNEQTVELDSVHAAQIKEYLDLLDLTYDIDIIHLPDVNTADRRTVISQPGLRYAQAKALIESLLLDETFSALSLSERTALQERILSEIRGRMMEDIILLETAFACPGKQVFTLQFPVGEFDMVVFDPDMASCKVFEIKHSARVSPQQYRHLADKEKCAMTSHRFGPITGKYVIYRGKTHQEREIKYLNAEEYLKSPGA